MENAARIDDLKWEISYQERIVETAPRGSLAWSVATARLVELWSELDELVPPTSDAV
jgi:hypothetical protein